MNLFTSSSILAGCALVLAAGCTSVNPPNPAEPKQPVQYRTGSNIPIRDARPPTEEEREQAAELARNLSRSGPGKTGN